ncbi:MAG TPA: tripartite tricarboxylate transporter substrate binding protein [Burkholderiales bacterium]|jgi:tripartite-type tricarboxylate transporter receptor subunit TctC|nr:tripartite tricarboxylate transporter substrate binding protein [Burkholderiales bacterium]
MKRTLTHALLLLCAASSAPALAEYPEKPIKLVVGFTAGGPTDITGRVAAQILTSALGAQALVDNRPGASGAIGAAQVANAAPDGYTLLVNVFADIVNPVADREPNNEILRRFAPVTMLAIAPNVLVVAANMPVSNPKELVEYARKHPGEVSFASAGLGTVSHLAGVIFASATGTQLVHVPYKGTAAAQTDLLGGRVNIMFDNLNSGLPNAAAGKVKALAITSPSRWSAAPNIPTMAEAGFPNADIMSVFGIVAPKGTPQPIIQKLSAVLLKGLQEPANVKVINTAGAEQGKMTVEQYEDYLKQDTARWKKLAAEGVLQPNPK